MTKPPSNTLPPTHKQITLGWTPNGPHYAIVEVATGKVTGGCLTNEEMLSVEAAEKKLLGEPK